MPESYDLWNISAREGAISKASSLSTGGVMPSGPGALEGFRPLSNLKIPSTVKVILGIEGYSFASRENFSLMLSLSYTLPSLKAWSNCLLRISACILVNTVLKYFPQFYTHPPHICILVQPSNSINQLV